MLVIVQRTNGKRVELRIYANDKVEQFKERVQDKLGIPPHRQRLIVQNKLMKDKNSVRDYNVTEGSVIHLVPQYEMLEFSRVHGIKMIQDDPSTSSREKKVDPSTSSRELQADPRTSSRELKADPRTSSRELEALPSEMNSPKMWITVKRLNDNTYNCNEIVFDIHQNKKVKRIKEHLHKMTGIPPQRQRLISNHGARMEDGRNMTAEDYNVTDGSVLYLLQASTF